MMNDSQLKIYTIGYGNRTWEEFIFLLKKYDIQILVDVRTLPYSRFFPQFRQSYLRDHLERSHVRYLFMGEALGGRPKNPELYTGDRVSYDKIKKSPIFKQGIIKLKELISDGTNVAMMCSELDQNNCHRKHLLTPEFIKDHLEVIHINKEGELEYEQEQPPTLF